MAACRSRGLGAGLRRRAKSSDAPWSQAGGQNGSLAGSALRTEQTVTALGRKYKTKPELDSDGTAAQLLSIAQWPDGKGTVLIVGHQPVLGQVIAQLLGLNANDCVVKKGAVWWLRNRERESMTQTVVVTVQAPEIV